MEPGLILKLLSFLCLLLLSGFFSSAETAFTAIGRLKLRSILSQESKHSDTLLKILKEPNKLITGILIGNNIANVAASAMATAVLLQLFNSFGFESFALKMIIVTTIMTLILLIFGEITPKTLVLKNPESYAISISRAISFFLTLFSPFILFFTGISTLIAKLLGISQLDTPLLLTEEEIKTIVKIGEEEGVIEKGEQEMIKSIFEFSDTSVAEIMTPRTDAVCLNASTTVKEAIKVVLDEGHSRIPVFEERIDTILGVIYAKDLLGIKETHASDTLKPYLRQAVFIPETKKLEELLHQMKIAQFQMAIVMDEHGGMSGLVTFEDVIEEIIGEVQDEYDDEEDDEFSSISPNSYLINAKMNIDDLAEKIDFEFPENDEYHTIGGFILSHLGKFPIEGERIRYQHLEIIIKHIQEHRIIQLKIIVHPKES